MGPDKAKFLGLQPALPSHAGHRCVYSLFSESGRRGVSGLGNTKYSQRQGSHTEKGRAREAPANQMLRPQPPPPPAFKNDAIQASTLPSQETGSLFSGEHDLPKKKDLNRMTSEVPNRTALPLHSGEARGNKHSEIPICSFASCSSLSADS